MAKRLSIAAVFGLAILGGGPALAQSGRAGWTTGDVVESTGTYLQRVPLNLPDPRGVGPHLDLTYASGSKNGFVGVGWTAGGFGFVERAHLATFEQFSLNGERLVPCVSGSPSPSCRSAVDAFGSSTYYYSTYFDDFRRIKLDTAGDRWIVWDRDGTQTVYGGSGHVFKQDTAAGAAAFRWLIASRTDRNGNQVTYDWQCEDNGAGGYADCYPYQVRYDNVIVEYEREARHDTVTLGKGFAGTTNAALQGRTTKRLKRIWVRVNDGAAYRLLRVYDLAYDDAHTWPPGQSTGSATSRSVLLSVREFGKDTVVNGSGALTGSAYPPLTLTYAGMAPVSLAPQYGVGPTLYFPCDHVVPPFIGDFDGDGCDDYAEATDGDDIRLYFSNCDGTFTANPVIDLDYTTSAIRRRRYGDFNGDGRTDLVLVSSSNASTDPLRIYLSTINPTTGVFSFTYAAGPTYKVNTNTGGHEEADLSRLDAGDFNGDGLTDFAIVEGCHHPLETTGCNTATPISILLTQNTNGNLSWTTVSGPSITVGPDTAIGDMLQDIRRPKYADYNGDRRTDVAIIQGTNTTVSNAVAMDVLYSRLGIPGAVTNFAGYTGTGPKIPYSRNPYVPPFGGFGGLEGDTRIRFGDVNGDGYTDLIWIQGLSGGDPGPDLDTNFPYSKVYLSAGSGGRFGEAIQAPVQSPWMGAYAPMTPAMVPIGDFNGDGRADIGKLGSGLTIYLSLGKDAGIVTYDTSVPGPANFMMDCGQVGDFDGDGRTDVGTMYGSNYNARIHRANGPTPDLLVGVDNGMGAASTIAYTPSTQWVNVARPPITQTATEVRTTSHGALAADDAYAYDGARFDYATLRPLGFRTTTVRQPDFETSGEPFGHRRLTFRQDSRSPAGLLETADMMEGAPGGSGRLLSRFQTTYWTGSTSASCATSAPFFTVAAAELDLAFDPAAGSCVTDWPVGTFSNCATRTRTEHDYDLTSGAACGGSTLVQTGNGYGNEIRRRLFGDWDRNEGQEHTVESVYPTTANVTDYVVDKVVASRLRAGTAGTGAITREEHSYYDGRDPGNGSAGFDFAVSKGNRTALAKLVRHGIDPSFVPYYAIERATFDSAGNLRTEGDALGRTTTYEYDAGFNKYLTAVVDNASHRRTLLNYDFVCGRALKDVEPNGNVAGASAYADCGGSCTNLALGKTATASGLWDPSGNPPGKVNDGNTGTNPACEHASGYCAIAATAGGLQGIGNYLQIDLGAVMSVKSVTVYGRRDAAPAQAQNLYLKTSTDGANWTSTFMADTTSASGYTVNTARLGRYVRVETSTVVYLSLYEIVVTGSAYVDCGGTCVNLAQGKTVTASGLWDPTGNPPEKVNDGNTGTNPACEHATGYCAIASDAVGGQAIGNYLQIDLGSVMSVKSVTVYGRRDAALTQGQNLYLKTSTDGNSWTSTYMADTTSPSGYTVNTAGLARYVRVETSTVVYLSLYEIVVTGPVSSDTYATRFTLDDLCRDTRMDRPGGEFEIYSYAFSGNDPASQWERIERPGPNGSNLWERRLFDGLGRLREERKTGPAPGMDIVRTLTYDLLGRGHTDSVVRFASEPEKLTTYHYDPLGRTKSVVNPGGSSKQVTYSMAAGYLSETSTDEEGHQILENHDGFGTVFQRTQGSAVTMYFNYLDARYVFDANGNWNYLYFDSLDRLIREVHPDRGTWDYVRWEDGQIRRVLDNQSPREITEFTYDLLGRKQTKTTRVGQAGQRTATWTYDQARPSFSNQGRLTGMQDASGTATYDYDVAGRLVKEVRTVGTDTYQFQNGYDAGGRLLWRSFPDSDSFGSAANPMRYDAAGRVNLVPNLLSGATYTAEGSLRSWTNANGTLTNRTVDPDRGWFTSVRTSVPGSTQCSVITLPNHQCVIDWCGDEVFCGPGTFQCCQPIPETVVQDLGYGRDLEGRITAVTSPFAGETWTYGFDTQHRLRSATSAPGSPDNRLYTYDGIGNMLTNSQVAGTYEYQFPRPWDPGSFMPHAVSRIGSRNYTYDRNGNMLTAPNRTFVYNGDGLPEWINGTQIFYDGDNRRLRTVSPTATRTYPSDDYEVAGSTVTKYLRVDGTILAKVMGSTRYWIHTDLLGTLQAITDSTGSVAWRQTYEPFGDEKANSMGYFESRGFTGWREDDFGIVDAGARCYDPEIGRFLSPDPALASFETPFVNPYAYAANDPVNATDPTGAQNCFLVNGQIICEEVVVTAPRPPDPWPDYTPAWRDATDTHASFENDPERPSGVDAGYTTYTLGMWTGTWALQLQAVLRYNWEGNPQYGLKLTNDLAHGRVGVVGIRVLHFDGTHFNTDILTRDLHRLEHGSEAIYNMAKVGTVKAAVGKLGTVAVVLDATSIAVADPKDQGPMIWRATASYTGAWAGGVLGGTLLAPVGLAPVGAFLGAAAGGYVGGYAYDQGWTMLPSGSMVYTKP